MANRSPTGPPAQHQDQQRAADDDDDGIDVRGWMDEHDLISQGCTLFPVFCTADIPLDVLNSFITQARDECPPDRGIAVCICCNTFTIV